MQRCCITQHRDLGEKQTTFCREVTAGVTWSSAFICQHSWSPLVSVSLISIDTSHLNLQIASSLFL